MSRPSVLARALGVTLVVSVCASCSHREPATLSSLKGYSLLFINIDTLRADHLRSYGYFRNTSPFLDRLAREGVTFTRAMANSSYTRESVAVLFSGRLPSSSGSVGWDARPADDSAPLAELFQSAGYRTGFFSNTTMLTDPHFTEGFQDVQHLTTIWGLSRAGPKLSARGIEFVKAAPSRPFMMYLHYLDPHGPYDPPRDLYLRFASSIFPNPIDVYTDVRPHCTALVRDGFGPGDPRFEDMVLRYDAEIADTDRSIEMLFRGLEELQVLQRTLVVISADHGEEFLDHGFVEHAWTLYAESLHIPLIFWAPQALRPQRIDALVSVADILPTLLTLMEVGRPPSALDGTSLVDRRADGFLWSVAARPAIAELLIGQRNVVRAVTDGEWKYIAAQRWLPPEERPAAVKRQDELQRVHGTEAADIWGPVTHAELYHLSRDPHEQHDVLSEFPAVQHALQQRLDGYLSTSHARARPAGAAGGGPLSPAETERLRALGYLEHSD